MDLNLDHIAVIHNEPEHRFEAEVDSLTSLITYMRSPGSITYNHTEVPPSQSGKGIAAKLTKAALDFARENRLRVIPQCSYVASYVRQNAQYHDLMSPEDLQRLLSQK